MQLLQSLKDSANGLIIFISPLQPELNGKPRALDAKILYADDESRESYTSRKWFLSPGQKNMMILTADPANPNRYQLTSIRY
ncbi:hypothetical protein [Coraliomargarita parva]|uniref:hypothetical protein n=1 Tax=Coraliomargarita parva TaxID=3014050 RepID=UPI0022B30F10|nr:hypothetical protein [Coraliomargarita parva]